MTSRAHVPPEPLKLPFKMPGNRRTKDHPLVWCIENLRTDEPKSSLAHHMGVRPQTLFKWLAHCREDRNFSLPLERAIQIAIYFSVPVALFRPDVVGLAQAPEKAAA